MSEVSYQSVKLSPSAGSNTQLHANAHPGDKMADHVNESPPLTRETLTGCLIPGFSPGAAPGLAGIWGKKWSMEAVYLPVSRQIAT